jgi:hypothetical protein
MMPLVRSRLFMITVIVVAFIAGGCRHKRIPGNHVASTVYSTPSAYASALDAGSAHDQAHPPIDCPLHKLGVSSAKIPRAQLLSLFSTAGLVLDEEKRDLLPYRVFLVFKKPRSGGHTRRGEKNRCLRGAITYRGPPI